MNRIKNKYQKLLTCILPLLILTGCGNAEFVEVQGIGLEDPSSTAYTVTANIAFFFDRLFANVAIFFNTHLNFETITNAVKSSSEYFNNISRLVAWFQVMALAYIAIRFGWMIVNEYILQQDNRMATPIMHQLKKLLIALVLTVAMPTIVFSSYLGSTYLGVSMAQQFKTGNDELNEKYQFLNKMNDVGVTYGAYCKCEIDGEYTKTPSLHSGEMNVAFPAKYPDAAYDATLDSETLLGGIGDFVEGASAFLNGKSVGELTRNRLVSNVTKNYVKSNPEHVSDATAGMKIYEEVWNETCGKTPSYRIGDAMAQNGYADVMISGQGRGISSLLSILVRCVFFGVAAWMVAKRTLDVVFLLLMSWFYIGDSVSNAPNNQAIATFGRKLLSICMTQFFVILEVGIYMDTINTANNAGGFNLIMGVAWIMFMLGTPTFIADICHDTGTGSDAITAGRFAKGAWNKFRGG